MHIDKGRAEEYNSLLFEALHKIPYDLNFILFLGP